MGTGRAQKPRRRGRGSAAFAAKHAAEREVTQMGLPWRVFGVGEQLMESANGRIFGRVLRLIAVGNVGGGAR